MKRKTVNLNIGNEKVIIFSDTHLSTEFDVAQYEYIKKAVNSADRVIINGDFWDYAYGSFDEFINSKWKKLFPILKKKKTIYLYGNHDRQEYCNKRVRLFSVKQGDECELKIENGKKGEFLIRHGGALAPSFDVRLPFIFANPPMFRFGNWLNLMGVKWWGEWYLHKFMVRNIKMKKFSKTLDGQVLVCGHSHFAEFDQDRQYINNGVIRWGLGQYLEIDKGKINLVRDKY